MQLNCTRGCRARTFGDPHISCRRGFTLIELLVVVAIISLLISILLPSLSKARSMARMVKCQATLKQFGTAHHMYANEADGWFVPHRVNNYGFIWFQWIKWRQFLAISPGWSYPDGLVCPDVPAELASNPTFNYGSNGTAGTWTPNIPKVEPMMPWRDGDKNVNGTTSGNADALRIFREKVKNPSAKAHNIDADDWNVAEWGANYTTYWDLTPHLNGGNGGKWNQVSYRHNQGANILMMDGHAEYRPKTDCYVFQANGTSVNWGPTNDLWYVYKP